MSSICRRQRDRSRLILVQAEQALHPLAASRSLDGIHVHAANIPGFYSGYTGSCGCLVLAWSVQKRLRLTGRSRNVTAKCPGPLLGRAAGFFAYTAHCHGQRILLCHAMGRHLMTETLRRTVMVPFVLVLLVSV